MAALAAFRVAVIADLAAQAFRPGGLSRCLVMHRLQGRLLRRRLLHGLLLDVGLLRCGLLRLRHVGYSGLFG